MVTHTFSLQVTATDQDGPVNSLLRYSIVSGDPLQQFSIHPRSGEISVAMALDREEVGLFTGSLIPHQEEQRWLTFMSPSQGPSLLSDGAGGR